MLKIVFIGAGSGFGSCSLVDILSFPELRETEIVLVDINRSHLEPVAQVAAKLIEHHRAPTRIVTAEGWRGGVLEGADFVMTSFAQGGPAYQGVPFHHEIFAPKRYGIHQAIADTAGIGGVLRSMRTAPELVAIGKDLEARSPGATILNYVNPMSILTRTMSMACPKVRTLGLCHNIQYGIREIAAWLNRSHKEFRYVAAGVNHMDWFLRLEHLDGRDAYPDLLRVGEENESVYRSRAVQFELLKHLGYWTTESSWHCAEYIPYFAPREKDREAVFLKERVTSPDHDATAPRWTAESDLVKQIDGRKPLNTTRSFEYGMHIMHALLTDNVYRMHLNVLNRGMILNLPEGYCVEVPCTVDRAGIHPHAVGELPIQLAALCRGMADMQTLASDAILEKDLRKALWSCIIDPATAASATPARIKQCFNELLDLEKPWLETYWGPSLRV